MSSYFITGVTSGIGRALARELVRRGHRVEGIGRRPLPPELSSEFGTERFFFSVCDVGRSEDVARVVAGMEKRGFLPDVAILNAAIHPEQSSPPFSVAVLEQVIEVNVLGALRWVEALLPRFETRGTGQFVAISSLAAYRGDARWVAYSASKAALSRSFESFRGRFSRSGIAFTTIHLGSVMSGMGKDARRLFTLSEDRAVSMILSAVDRRLDTVSIPKISRMLLEVTRILPDWMFSRLVGYAAPSR